MGSRRGTAGGRAWRLIRIAQNTDPGLTFPAQPGAAGGNRIRIEGQGVGHGNGSVWTGIGPNLPAKG